MASRTGDARVAMRAPRINVGEAERWLSTVAGAALAAWALGERDRRAGVAAIAGAVLMYRGTTGHCPAYAAAGIDTAHQDWPTRRELAGAGGIHVEESITIGVPAAELYRFWRQFDNLPRFMKHLESVTATGPNLWKWVAHGPAGLRVSWTAEVNNEVENKVIGWRSIEGSTITTAGSVHFEDEANGRGTRVHVHLQYNPPGGRLGAAIAWLFGEEPNLTVREDLRRLKAILETGEAPTIEGQPHGRRGPISTLYAS